MLTSLEATKIVREAVQVLIEKPIETVASCDRNDEGFVFTIEVCENKAPISDGDVLATYEIVIDRTNGEVLRYARLSRSRRGDVSRNAA